MNDEDLQTQQTLHNLIDKIAAHMERMGALESTVDALKKEAEIFEARIVEAEAPKEPVLTEVVVGAPPATGVILLDNPAGF